MRAHDPSIDLIGAIAGSYHKPFPTTRFDRLHVGIGQVSELHVFVVGQGKQFCWTIHRAECANRDPATRIP